MRLLKCEKTLNVLVLALATSFFVSGFAFRAHAGTRAQENSSFRNRTLGSEEFPESRFGAPATAALLDDPYQLMLKEVNQEGSTKKSGRGLASVESSSDEDSKSDVKNGVLPSSILRSGTQEVSVIAHELGFFPRSIFVTKDTPVRLFITSAAKRSLCVMMDEFKIKRQVRSQAIEEISFTPTTPGQYRFYCPINGMEGTLWVKEFTGSLNAQRVQWNASRGEF